ncbi:MAG: glycosyltransferase family 2 protein [Bacteroidales bacterium]|nr:glycosyltransferase family 2 protein [Bacteroidales bacterium]
MAKLLTIIIPTYNMAQLLPRWLESLVNADLADEYLEALVVNDGSKDDSLIVARNWEQLYPEIVRVIDKPNGNYGSTINAALPVAQGVYVKVLDSDDWFSIPALNQLLNEIVTMEQQGRRVDIINTHFTQHAAEGQYEVIRYNTMGREPFAYGQIYDLDEVLSSGYVRQFLMHALCYRTDLLRSIGYYQTEGISYTDTEWASHPIYHAESIVFYDINLYQYNLDRVGQTMDPSVVVRQIGQMERVLDSLVSYYDVHYDQLTASRKVYMKHYIEHRLRLFYKLYLLDMPRSVFSPTELCRIDEKYASFIERRELRFSLYPENKLLRIDYIKYWNKYHERWPLWLECLNHEIDVVVKWLYVRIFRR